MEKRSGRNYRKCLIRPKKETGCVDKIQKNIATTISSQTFPKTHSPRMVQQIQIPQEKGCIHNKIQIQSIRRGEMDSNQTSVVGTILGRKNKSEGEYEN